MSTVSLRDASSRLRSRRENGANSEPIDQLIALVDRSTRAPFDPRALGPLQCLFTTLRAQQKIIHPQWLVTQVEQTVAAAQLREDEWPSSHPMQPTEPDMLALAAPPAQRQQEPPPPEQDPDVPTPAGPPVQQRQSLPMATLQTLGAGNMHPSNPLMIINFDSQTKAHQQPQPVFVHGIFMSSQNGSLFGQHFVSKSDTFLDGAGAVHALKLLGENLRTIALRLLIEQCTRELRRVDPTSRGEVKLTEKLGYMLLDRLRTGTLSSFTSGRWEVRSDLLVPVCESIRTHHILI